MALLDANKGRPMQGIVEQVRDGSTLRVYLLPEFQFVQVFVAGIQVNVLSLDCLPVNFSFNFFMPSRPVLLDVYISHSFCFN